MRSGVIEIVVADPCEVARIGTRVLLESASGLRVLAEAADEAAALRALEHYQPRVLVMAAALHAENPTLLARLRRASPNTARLVTLPDAASERPSALEREADGYVSSCASARELQEAVAAVARGRIYTNVATSDSDAPLAPHDLSLRELEVLRLMAEGHTQREIAEQMQLSVRSVELHRARVSERLGLETRAELVHYALRTGLLRSRLDVRIAKPSITP
jgi:two-component system response regulator NreC